MAIIEVPPVLDIVDLHVHIKTAAGIVRAVNGISLSVRQGEVEGIVGESGSGKSVTARSILRILPGYAYIPHGSIHFMGKNLLSCSDREMEGIRGKDISMIFQEPSAALNPVLTVGSQIAEVLMYHHGMSRKAAFKEAVRYLKDVNIPSPEERARDYPHQLSGGMQQRCVIAIALACAPRLMLADEPTTSLDVTIQAQILSLINRLVHERGMSLILISHNIAAVAQIADRITVMYAGRVMEASTTEDIIERPGHPYTRLLLQAMPSLSGRKGNRMPEIAGDVPDMTNPPAGCPFHPRCPQALEICSSTIPDETRIGPGHRIFCHLHAL